MSSVSSSGVSTVRSRRLVRCGSCRLPPALCLCSALVRKAARTRVVVLVHHIEMRKSSNTGTLASLLLEDVSIVVRGLPAAAPLPVPAGRRLVLFPAPNARLLVPEDALGEPPVLVVPDGSWAQARKAQRRDPMAADAEAVRLPDGLASRYTLRRPLREGGVSTLEALALAMGILEGEAMQRHLLDAFETFVERSLRARQGV